MKFKAILTEPTTLASYLQALSVLHSDCVVCLTADVLHLIVPEAFTNGEMAYVEIPVPSIFSGYMLERKTASKDIPFRINTQMLIRAVKSGEQASRITMKLARGGDLGAFLHFSVNADSVTVQQSVPVAMLADTEFSSYAEPQLPTPNIQFVMPPGLAALRVILEKMKLYNEDVHISVSRTGQVIFSVESVMVDIKTFYNQQIIPTEEEKETPASSDSAQLPVKCTVGIKRLLRALQCKTLERNAHKIVGCILEKIGFVLYLAMNNDCGVMTYYLPLKIEE